MDKLHKEKINTAIGLCEKRFSQFCAAVEARYTKEEASQIKYLLLQNTVFAGGVFRSIFTDTAVKDIDIFFTSLDAAIEFKDRFLKPHVAPKGLKSLFLANDITNYFTFNWYGTSRKDPPLSFITQNAGMPAALLNTFDFTFNQHYFNLNTYEMVFDIDTFSKVGQYNTKCESWKEKMYVFKRALRFMDQGYRLDNGSLIRLVQQIANNKDMLKDELGEAGSGGPEAEQVLPLTGKRYTEHDYFGVKEPNKAHEPFYTDPATWVIIAEGRNRYKMLLPDGTTVYAESVGELQEYRDYHRARR